ncbi:MAG: peptidylprolyl isomerase [Bacteroidetes bacterium]|nr:peptidylprolyl isomerase [Bacteroidota bacterium]
MKKTLKILLLTLLITVSALPVRSQVINDSVVDGVVAVVGASMILRSDIESQYMQFRAQGSIQGGSEKVKCQILEGLLFQKLLLNQAQVDSVKVTDAQVDAEMDHRMRMFISQIGSVEKLEEYYQKSISEIKNEMREIIREQIMVGQTQEKITKDVSITPSEVKAYFKKLPKDSLPDIASEIEVGMIMKAPAIGDAEKQACIDRLKGFKERIKKGDEFSTLAVLYSEDPGSAKKGGELGMFKRGDMRVEFEAVAFRLKPGEVSDVVETEDGFHIIQMIERKGEYINVRHILLQPKVSQASLARAKSILDSVATMIEQKKMTFADAVAKYSDDVSKNNGGLILNPRTGTSKNEAKDLDPKIFFVIDKLKVGEISAPVLYRTDRNKEEYRIYYLKTRTNPHKANLQDDYSVIRDIAENDKKTDVMKEWIREKILKTYVMISESYRKCPFEREWVKK